MKKRGWVAVIVIVVIGVVVFLMQKKSVQDEIAIAPNARLAMTDAEISAAINYGKNHKDDFMVDFQKPWTVFLGYGSGKGSATIFTPYHYLAFIARNSARENSDMDSEVLCRLCAENYKDLYFEVILYGDEDGFDRDYKTVVLKDGREIPILKIFHQGYDQAREYTVSSQQKLYFPVDILQEKDKITLRIVKPKASSLDFVFELERVR